jgi:hypothetical protein
MHFETLAAFVRDGARCLEEDQGLRGLDHIHSAGECATGEGEKVPFVIVAAQGEAESALAGGSAVTCASRASCLGENRLHLVTKARGFPANQRCEQGQEDNEQSHATENESRLARTSNLDDRPFLRTGTRFRGFGDPFQSVSSC